MKRSGSRAPAVWLWLALLLICAVILAQTRLRTDMGAFLPRSAPMAEQVLTSQVSRGAPSHLLMFAITGAPAPVLAGLSEIFAQRLRQQDAFISVLNGDPASFAGIQVYFWANRYLLSADVTPARFTVAGLHAALVDDLGLLGSDLGPLFQQSLPADPTAEMLGLLAQGGSGPRSQNGVWFSPAGDTALLLAHTRAPGFDIGAQARTLALAADIFAAARAAVPGAGAARLACSGPGVFAVQTQAATKRDVTRLSLLASLGAILLLGFAYRSPWVLGLGLLPVITGALAATAAVALAFGFLHGVTLGFGVTLIGESLDYAIYLFTQTPRGGTARDTLRHIWPTLRLGVLTSVVGFAAMLFSDFTGFAQLGLFSIAGLLAASATTRFVLPALVPPDFHAAGADFLGRPLQAVIRQRATLRWLILAAVLAAGAALALHRGGFWDENLNDLSPIPAAAQQLDDTLRQDLGVPDQRYFAVLEAPTEQGALAQSAKLAAVLAGQQAQGALRGFEAPGALLPSEAAQRARQAALPEVPLLAARLTQALSGLPFRPASFAPFLRDVAAQKHAPLITAASLPLELKLELETMLFRRGQAWDVFMPLRAVARPQGVAAAIAQAGPPGAQFVDIDQQSASLLHHFQREATLLAEVGSAAILAVLVLGLRSLRRAVIVAAPLAAAVVLTCTLLTLGGARISIFEVVGFLLIVAVGSNYCLFFERAEPDAAARHRAIAAITLANVCTVCAYGLMACSGIPVLHDLGKTVALGTFLSLIFAAILIPPGELAA